MLGGTTAWSGRWIWAPGNALARRAGIAGDGAAPRHYRQAVRGNHLDAARVDAFLAATPEMVAFFEPHAALCFEGDLGIPDIHGDAPGAGTGGRSVIARAHDGRKPGRAIALLRPPPRQTTFKGMTIQSGSDLRAFMTITRSWKACAHVGARGARHLRDLAVHGRGMDLRNGNALVARLVHWALDLGVDLQLPHIAREERLASGQRWIGLRAFLGALPADMPLSPEEPVSATPGRRELDARLSDLHDRCRALMRDTERRGCQA